MSKERFALIKGTDYRASEKGFIINKHGRHLLGTTVGMYARHTIRVNKQSVSINTARTIYEAFNGIIPEGFEIDHIDGDPRNNQLSNLRCVSHKQNMSNPITRKRLSRPRRRLSIIYEKFE